ncbi:uncharacterized protein ACA1_224570 [Acanthamoeba castellanii str. Neff]|uniref:Uncharacterized protein n=1 Tax=Acanthamoeba castellanii (strain ATCC 30010 / Neff) TaxID=1257118 RepID=L8GT51_ACACF|nr:uncharacterized protein ACA1_224570 [Acanthamoeba castellanii str. Neff]ELR16077.1 hypothetical protein ACA1_224570 [Acanthamoeba castellanii str. Neff]
MKLSLLRRNSSTPPPSPVTSPKTTPRTPTSGGTTGLGKWEDQLQQQSSRRRTWSGASSWAAVVEVPPACFPRPRPRPGTGRVRPGGCPTRPTPTSSCYAPTPRHRPWPT